MHGIDAAPETDLLNMDIHHGSQQAYNWHQRSGSNSIETFIESDDSDKVTVF